MFNQDEEKMECAVGNREMGFWQYKKAEIVLISFLTSGFAAFICLWLLVLPNSNNLINHVLSFKLGIYDLFSNIFPFHVSPFAINVFIGAYSNLKPELIAQYVFKGYPTDYYL